MILAIPAMLSRTTKDIIAQAMKDITTENMLTWANNTLGKTTNSKKRNFHVKADQELERQCQTASI